MAAGETIQETPLFGDNASLMTFLNSIFGTENSGNSTTTNELDPHTSELLTQFLGTLMPELSSDEYSPAAAERDSKAAIDTIFRQYRESIPNILGGSNAAGAYNSSTAQLLSNDAYSRAVGEAGKLQLSTKNQYAQNRNSARTQAVNLLLGLLSATRRTNTNTNSNNNRSTNAARNAGLAAGALQGLTSNRRRSTSNNQVRSRNPQQQQNQNNNNDSDDNSSAQSQIDAANAPFEGETGDAQAADIQGQILDSLGLGDFGLSPLEPIAETNMNPMDNIPDFDFSDSFNFDFFDSSDSSGDTSGDGSEGGDFSDSGDSADSDFPDDPIDVSNEDIGDF